MRYIWEGDHLPPHIRDAVDTLDDVDQLLDDALEESYRSVLEESSNSSMSNTSSMFNIGGKKIDNLDHHMYVDQKHTDKTSHIVFAQMN